MSAQERRAAIGEPRQRRQAEQGRVGSDVGVELRADPSERFVERERVEVAAAFVEHVAGDRGEARGRPDPRRSRGGQRPGR